MGSFYARFIPDRFAATGERSGADDIIIAPDTATGVKEAKERKPRRLIEHLSCNETGAS